MFCCRPQRQTSSEKMEDICAIVRLRSIIHNETRQDLNAPNRKYILRDFDSDYRRYFNFINLKTIVASNCPNIIGLITIDKNIKVMVTTMPCLH